MTDLVEAVRREHRKVLELVDRLEETHAKWPLGERADRKTVHALVALESRHEVAEAQVLWPVVRDTLRELVEVKTVAQGQERDGRRMLHRLHKTAGSEESLPLVPQVAKLIRLHVALEESQILSPLESTLDPNDSIRLGQVFERISAKSPKRPHPLTPAIPGVLTVAGPMARRADRLRDFLRLR